MTVITYERGSELPDLEITWSDLSGAVVEFASGYTFVVLVGPAGGTPVIEKTTGITGNDTAPNVVIAWAVDELDALATGRHKLRVVATETATSKQRSVTIDFAIAPAQQPS